MTTRIDYYDSPNYDNSVVIRTGATAGNVVGQSFTWNATNCALNQMKFYLQATGTLTGLLYARLYEHTGSYGAGGVPGSSLAVSGAVNANTLPVGYFDWVTFTFIDGYVPTNGTNYFVAVQYPYGDATHYVSVGYDGSSPSHGGNGATYPSGVWAAQTYDFIFDVYRAELPYARDARTNMDVLLQPTGVFARDARTNMDVLVSYTATTIKTINGLAKSSVKTADGLAIASTKTFNGLA